MKELSAAETLRQVTAHGAIETAARTKQLKGTIRYSFATERAQSGVTQDLRGALPSPAKGHYVVITAVNEESS